MCRLKEMVVGIFGAAYILVSCVGAEGVGDLASAFVVAGGVGDLEALGVGDLEALGVEDIAGPFWWAIANLVLGVLDLDFRTGARLVGFLESSCCGSLESSIVGRESFLGNLFGGLLADRGGDGRDDLGGEGRANLDGGG